MATATIYGTWNFEFDDGEWEREEKIKRRKETIKKMLDE